MDEPNIQAEPAAVAMNSCLSCKQGKRRCNKVRPSCSTCSRVGRNCTYEEDALLYPNDATSQRSQSLLGKSDPRGSTLSPVSSFHLPMSSGFASGLDQQVDPYRHETLRNPTVNIALSMEVSRNLGAVDKVHALAIKYFETIWTRMPIICRRKFMDRIPAMYSVPEADFLVLCLCVHLLLEYPTPGIQSMQSSLYVNIKSKISLLESTNVLSLAIIQARLLITFYEMGHGINPAASISIGACASSARALGLNKKSFQSVAGDEDALIEAEQEKRVWWGVIMLDRFINLCQGSSHFSTEDPKSDDHLPFDDSFWAQEIIPSTPAATLATPSDITVGPFARECQISHLAGRVLRHVLNPTSDPAFHREEALQLERTLQAFMPLLIEEQSKYGLYCAALGICVNGLFTLYDSAYATSAEDSKPQLLQSIESCALCISQFSHHLFSDREKVSLDTLSPLIPYSLYQAALVQFRLWKRTSMATYKEMFDSLLSIMGFFEKRWENAGQYRRALEAQEIGWPITVLPLQNFTDGPMKTPSGPFWD